MLANFFVTLLIVVLAIISLTLFLIVVTDRKRMEIKQRNWNAESGEMTAAIKKFELDFKALQEKAAGLDRAHGELLSMLENWKTRKLTDGVDGAILDFMSFDKGVTWYSVDVLPSKAIKIRKRLTLGEDDRYLEKLLA